jgi:pimeloyl-ACP methyl ester carboxylesterase
MSSRRGSGQSGKRTKGTHMSRTVTSRDGTHIAYDSYSYGSGPALILVGGALTHRRFKKLGQLAELLADRFTVVNYDRRGRGDSGDTKPYALQREIEDIEALIEAVGGSASLWGWSSGGALALRAAGAGIGVDRVAMYEPPFLVDPEDHVLPADYARQLDYLLSLDRRADAVKLFTREAVGAPAPFVFLMQLMPMWRQLKAVAHTLPYDRAAMGDTMGGKPLRPEEWAAVKVPVLVAYGSKTPAALRKGSEAIAEVLPDAELRAVPGQRHNVSMKVLAPMLAEFLADGRDRRATVHA